jgi:hypothetical protein
MSCHTHNATTSAIWVEYTKEKLVKSLNTIERKMAERAPTGGEKIPSSGVTTPEHNAVRKSSEDISPAIVGVRDDFVSRAYSCGLIPTRNPSNPPLDVVLDEISLNPVNYYSLQHVVATLNVGGRFDKGIGKMEKKFQCKDNEIM